ncbi:MAG: fasciclin domain-containing protein [Balneolia bacterium]|nr:fasciclin domain-containing protein [Balneolia bacterium]
MKSLSIISTAIALIFMMTFNAHAQYEVASAESAEYTSADIVEIASSDERFSTLAYLLQETGLAATLQNGETYTVFAPTNEAFEELPEETLNELMADQEALREVLLSHVVVGEVTSEEVVNLEAAMVATGEELRIKSYDGKVKVANATVTEADIMAANGVIHIIDSVIIPGKDSDYDRDSGYGDK